MMVLLGALALCGAWAVLLNGSRRRLKAHLDEAEKTIAAQEAVLSAADARREIERQNAPLAEADLDAVLQQEGWLRD